MDRPRIPVDFNTMFEDGGDFVLLSTSGEAKDSAGNRIVLAEGLPVYVYEEDPTDAHPNGVLIADGTAVRDIIKWSGSIQWNCRIDEKGIRRWPMADSR
jgi:hypothetical protein